MGLVLIHPKLVPFCSPIGRQFEFLARCGNMVVMGLSMKVSSLDVSGVAVSRFKSKTKLEIPTFHWPYI